MKFKRITKDEQCNQYIEGLIKNGCLPVDYLYLKNNKSFGVYNFSGSMVGGFILGCPPDRTLSFLSEEGKQAVYQYNEDINNFVEYSALWVNKENRGFYTILTLLKMFIEYLKVRNKIIIFYCKKEKLCKIFEDSNGILIWTEGKSEKVYAADTYRFIYLIFNTIKRKVFHKRKLLKHEN